MGENHGGARRHGVWSSELCCRHRPVFVIPQWVGWFYGEQAPCPHHVAEATCVDVWSRAHSCPQQAGLWATGGSYSLAFIQGLPSWFLSQIALSSLLQTLCFLFGPPTPIFKSSSSSVLSSGPSSLREVPSVPLLESFPFTSPHCTFPSVPRRLVMGGVSSLTTSPKPGRAGVVPSLCSVRDGVWHPGGHKAVPCLGLMAST